MAIKYSTDLWPRMRDESTPHAREEARRYAGRRRTRAARAYALAHLDFVLGVKACESYLRFGLDKRTADIIHNSVMRILLRP